MSLSGMLRSKRKGSFVPSSYPTRGRIDVCNLVGLVCVLEVILIALSCSTAYAMYPDAVLLAPWGWQCSPADAVYQRMSLRSLLETADSTHLPCSFPLALKESFWDTPDPKAIEQDIERLAMWYETTGHKEEALFHYQRLLDQFPELPAASTWRAHLTALYYHLGNIHALIDLFTACTRERTCTFDDRSSYLIGQALYRGGSYTEAEEILGGIDKGILYPFATYTRAQIAYKRNEYQRALDLFQACQSAASRAPEERFLQDLATLARARTLHHTHHFQEAVAEYARIHHSHLLFPEALMGMGWAYEALGHYPKAIAYMTAVAQAHPDARMLGMSYLETARLFSAAKDYKEAFRRYESLQESLTRQVNTLSSCIDTKECIEQLVEVVVRDVLNSPSGSHQDETLPLESNNHGMLARIVLRAAYLSERFKGLSELFARSRLLRDQIQDTPSQSPGHAARYILDPFDKAVISPETATTAHLLDVALRLFDLELHTALAAEELGLLDRASAKAGIRESCTFWRTVLERVILTGTSVEQLISRIDAAQRMIPKTTYSLEDRQTFLGKLLSLRERLQQVQAETDRYGVLMNTLVSGRWPRTRGSLLDTLVQYGRTLFLARQVAEHPIVVSLPIEPTSSKTTDRQELLKATTEDEKQRCDRSENTIRTLFAQEVKHILQEEIKALTALLAETEHAFAQALVQKDRSAVLPDGHNEATY